ncbi:MAG TPA: DUF6709 family protein [Bacillota bacterium]|nr:DUF6709 family protein [Bacillota bacterium]
MLQDGFVLKQIKKYNRRLFIITIILVCLAVTSGNGLAKYWYNLQKGPFEITARQLARIQSVDSLREYYVKVKGRKLYRLSKIHDYYLLEINHTFLMIKGKVNEDSLEFSGELKDLSDDYQKRLNQALNNIQGWGKRPKTLIYPVFLEAGNLQTNKNTDYWLFGALLVLSIRNIFILLRRNSDPSLHPSCKHLSKLGPVGTIVANIDSEVSGTGEDFGKSWVIVTDSWIIVKKLFKLQLIALSDVVWAYQKVTSHHYNFIPVGKTHELIVYTKDHEVHEFKVKNGLTGEEVVELIGSNAPWAFTGYSEKLANMWKQNRSNFIQVVQGRFDESGR